jgi:hypothetical protein
MASITVNITVDQGPFMTDIINDIMALIEKIDSIDPTVRVEREIQHV